MPGGSLRRLTGLYLGSGLDDGWVGGEGAPENR